MYKCIYNGFNINNFYILYYKNVFAHKFYYCTYDSSTFSFSASMFQVYKCVYTIKYHVAQLMNTLKWCPIPNQIF